MGAHILGCVLMPLIQSKPIQWLRGICRGHRSTHWCAYKHNTHSQLESRMRERVKKWCTCTRKRNNDIIKIKRANKTDEFLEVFFAGSANAVVWQTETVVVCDCDERREVAVVFICRHKNTQKVVFVSCRFFAESFGVISFQPQAFKTETKKISRFRCFSFVIVWVCVCGKLTTHSHTHLESSQN